MSWGCVVTRARVGGIGAEKFGYYERAHVRQCGFTGDWLAFRPWNEVGVHRTTWAEALAYALGEDME